MNSAKTLSSHTSRFSTPQPRIPPTTRFVNLVRTPEVLGHPGPRLLGETIRYRPNRGGDRHANSALYRIVRTRMSSDEQTRRYVARCRTEGLNTAEIMRCLKRYLAAKSSNSYRERHNNVGGV